MISSASNNKNQTKSHNLANGNSQNKVEKRIKLKLTFIDVRSATNSIYVDVNVLDNISYVMRNLLAMRIIPINFGEFNALFHGKVISQNLSFSFLNINDLDEISIVKPMKRRVEDNSGKTLIMRKMNVNQNQIQNDWKNKIHLPPINDIINRSMFEELLVRKVKK